MARPMASGCSTSVKMGTARRGKAPSWSKASRRACRDVASSTDRQPLPRHSLALSFSSVTFGQAERPFRIAVTAMAIAIAFMGLGLNFPLASAAIDQPRPDLDRSGGDRAPDFWPILASAAPREFSAAPRSRPLLETSPRAEAKEPDAAIPRPPAKPSVTRNSATMPSSGTFRAPRAAAPDKTSAPDKTAAPEMPRPVARPKGLASRAATFGTPATWKSLPTASSSAIAAPGLQKAGTSLLGVLETSAGREALLRTGSGQVVKVARGHMVEGWRVNSIDRDAIRLTRAGETRTLRMLSN